MGKLACPDYYQIEGSLSDEEIMTQNLARDFVVHELLPVITEYHRQGSFPTPLIAKMARLGFLGADLPIALGGSGLNSVAYGLLMQELERGDAAVRSFCSVTGSLVLHPIAQYGSEEQKKRWLPALIQGEAVGCFGLTEPDHGSDPAGMVTRAVRKGDGWVLNGAKIWITNGSIADVAVVWAKDETDQVRGFLVEKGRPGFSTVEMKGKFSLRASNTGELIFSDCRLREQDRLPGAEGLKAPLSCLTQARYGIAWGGLGSAIACYEAALGYAKERIQFGKPIAAFQLTQQKLVEMLVEITKAQLIALQLGRLKDQGKLRHTQVSLAKMNNVAIARRVASLAREILGANGILDEYPVIRHLMNIESVYTYEGTHDIHTLILGQDITGLNAFC